MRKLQLDLDALQVDTFDTMAGEGGKGTVLGAALTDGCEPVPMPIQPSRFQFQVTCGTCYNTCKATCDDATCAATCFETGCATCLITCNPSCNWCLNP